MGVAAASPVALEERMRLVDKVSRRQSLRHDGQSGVSVFGGAGEGQAGEREHEEQPHRVWWLGGDSCILSLLPRCDSELPGSRSQQSSPLE